VEFESLHCWTVHRVLCSFSWDGDRTDSELNKCVGTKQIVQKRSSSRALHFYVIPVRHLALSHEPSLRFDSRLSRFSLSILRFFCPIFRQPRNSCNLLCELGQPRRCRSRSSNSYNLHSSQLLNQRGDGDSLDYIIQYSQKLQNIKSIEAQIRDKAGPASAWRGM
jgi:hypothetical protein